MVTGEVITLSRKKFLSEPRSEFQIFGFMNKCEKHDTVQEAQDPGEKFSMFLVSCIPMDWH